MDGMRQRESGVAREEATGHIEGSTQIPGSSATSPSSSSPTPQPQLATASSSSLSSASSTVKVEAVATAGAEAVATAEAETVATPLSSASAAAAASSSAASSSSSVDSHPDDSSATAMTSGSKPVSEGRKEPVSMAWLFESGGEGAAGAEAAARATAKKGDAGAQDGSIAASEVGNAVAGTEASIRKAEPGAGAEAEVEAGARAGTEAEAEAGAGSDFKAVPRAKASVSETTNQPMLNVAPLDCERMVVRTEADEEEVVGVKGKRKHEGGKTRNTGTEIEVGDTVYIDQPEYGEQYLYRVNGFMFGITAKQALLVPLSTVAKEEIDPLNSKKVSVESLALAEQGFRLADREASKGASAGKKRQRSLTPISGGRPSGDSDLHSIDTAISEAGTDEGGGEVNEANEVNGQGGEEAVTVWGEGGEGRSRRKKFLSLKMREAEEFSTLVGTKETSQVKRITQTNRNSLLSTLASVASCHFAQPSEVEGIVPPSNFRGVSWHPGTHKWLATIYHSGSTECLGLFDDDMEAARVFDRHARKHGQMPNFVLDGTRKGFNRRWVAPVADPWFTPMGPALLSSAVTVGMVV
mmetsp:Transcript_57734/g.159174  ORF Transcript_57734/g.159174 Transcript_57734/m.159174 type:complete len:582 (+) Transcript_57734:946-2691(+)